MARSCISQQDEAYVRFWPILLQKSAAADGRRLSRYAQPALIRRR